MTTHPCAALNPTIFIAGLRGDGAVGGLFDPLAVGVVGELAPGAVVLADAD